MKSHTKIIVQTVVVPSNQTKDDCINIVRKYSIYKLLEVVKCQWGKTNRVNTDSSCNVDPNLAIVQFLNFEVLSEAKKFDLER